MGERHRMLRQGHGEAFGAEASSCLSSKGPNPSWSLLGDRGMLLPVGFFSVDQSVLGLGSIRSLSCLCCCLSSRVSLAGTGMQPFPHQSGGFSLPGILGKRAKSSFLVPCFTRLAASHPSQSPEAVSSLPCLLPRSTAGIASG